MTKPCSDKTFGIYVPSYNRSDRIMTQHVLNHCTYVVRESEKQAYLDAGVVNLIAAPDEEINSLSKVRQWIIDNSPEDVIVQLDDDISRFSYVNKNNVEAIEDKDIIDMELGRIAQLLSDLDIGFASIRMQENVIKYTSEFRFQSTCGLIVWFNKSALKGRYDPKVRTKSDTDFQLQELLKNRIILVPCYIRAKAQYDVNAGGNNTAKTSANVQATVDYLQAKWGKYFEHNYQKNQSFVRVKR